MLVQIGDTLINLGAVTHIVIYSVDGKVTGYCLHFVNTERLDLRAPEQVRAFASFLAGLKFGVGQLPQQPVH